jgi:hypothetical protein
MTSQRERETKKPKLEKPENWGSMSASAKTQVKSSKYSPQSKEQNPQQAEQGHAQIQQCV